MSNDISSTIQDFIHHITGHMQIQCDVSISQEESGSTRVVIQAADNGKLLIGKNGQNLKAMEHILRIVCLRQNPDLRAVVLDVNNYRQERVQELSSAVHAAAVRVRESRKSEALEPMSSYERRVAHTELASYSDLTTESVGQEPHRRVVIKPL